MLELQGHSRLAHKAGQGEWHPCMLATEASATSCTWLRAMPGIMPCTPRYRLGDEGIEGSPVKKDLWVLIEEKLDFSQQCAVPALKNNCILGYIQSSMASSSR